MAGKRFGGTLLAASLSGGSRQHFRYLDFRSFSTLAADQALLGQLISSYQAIFGDPNGWAEHYTDDDVLQKLKHELSGQAQLRLCVDPADHIVGFCWAQALAVDGIAHAIGTIKYYQSIGAPDVLNPLCDRFGEREVIYLHDLGIDPRCRGRIPLTQLVYPVLDGLAKRANVTTVLFWSIADTNISRLAKRALFHRILALGEMRFYSGDLWASRTRPKDIVSRLRSSAVAGKLNKVRRIVRGSSKFWSRQLARLSR